MQVFVRWPAKEKTLAFFIVFLLAELVYRDLVPLVAILLVGYSVGFHDCSSRSTCSLSLFLSFALRLPLHLPSSQQARVTCAKQSPQPGAFCVHTRSTLRFFLSRAFSQPCEVRERPCKATMSSGADAQAHTEAQLLSKLFSQCALLRNTHIHTHEHTLVHVNTRSFRRFLLLLTSLSVSRFLSVAKTLCFLPLRLLPFLSLSLSPPRPKLLIYGISGTFARLCFRSLNFIFSSQRVLLQRYFLLLWTITFSLLLLLLLLFLCVCWSRSYSSWKSELRSIDAGQLLAWRNDPPFCCNQLLHRSTHWPSTCTKKSRTFRTLETNEKYWHEFCSSSKWMTLSKNTAIEEREGKSEGEKERELWTNMADKSSLCSHPPAQLRSLSNEIASWNAGPLSPSWQL